MDTRTPSDGGSPAGEARIPRPAAGPLARLLPLLGELHLIVPAPPADWDGALAGPAPDGALAGPAPDGAGPDRACRPPQDGGPPSPSGGELPPDQQGVGAAE